NRRPLGNSEAAARCSSVVILSTRICISAAALITAPRSISSKYDACGFDFWSLPNKTIAGAFPSADFCGMTYLLAFGFCFEPRQGHATVALIAFIFLARENR